MTKKRTLPDNPENAAVELAGQAIGQAGKLLGGTIKSVRSDKIKATLALMGIVTIFGFIIALILIIVSKNVLCGTIVFSAFFICDFVVALVLLLSDKIKEVAVSSEAIKYNSSYPNRAE